MTGANSGDAEDLLGQFLAHRAAPDSARSTVTPPVPPVDRPAASSDESSAEGAAEGSPAEEPDADASTAVDDAVEESLDGPVYELADEPLDFSEPSPPAEPQPPEPPVSDTLAHAGAVLEAFASGTLEVAPDTQLDHELGNDAYEVEPAVENIDPVAPSHLAQPPASSPANHANDANDASRAVLAAFLGTTGPDPLAAPLADPLADTTAEPEPATSPEAKLVAEPAPVPAPVPAHAAAPEAALEPEPGAVLVPDDDREADAPPAAPDEAAAFEALAVSSPLAREAAAPRAPRAPEQPTEPDGRPDSTAASATVFAAFQEQLAKQDVAPVPARSRPAEPAHRIEQAAPLAAEPARAFLHEPIHEPLAEPHPETTSTPDTEVELPIAAPVARALAPRSGRQRPPKPEPKVTAPRLPAAEPEPARPPAVPHEVVFKPRRVARALVALILLVFLAASAVACWWAYRDRTLVPVGIAATVLIATGIVWATRAGSSVAHLSVKGGRLEITRDGTRTVFDLASQYTEIEVHGTPGKRNWRVLFGRRGLPPYVVDASMVSPAEFMRVLDYYRSPENRTGR